MQAETECFLPEADQRYLQEHGIAVDYGSSTNLVRGVFSEAFESFKMWTDRL